MSDETHPARGLFEWDEEKAAALLREKWYVSQEAGSQTLWIETKADGWERPIARMIHGEPDLEDMRAHMIAEAPKLRRQRDRLLEVLREAVNLMVAHDWRLYEEGSPAWDMLHEAEAAIAECEE